MSKKLKYLTKISLNKKIKSKWFYIANIILCVLIIGLINADSIIKFFGGDFDATKSIMVVDNTGYVYEEFSAIYNASLTYMEGIGEAEIIETNKGIEEIKVCIENMTYNLKTALVLLQQRGLLLCVTYII